jgi:L-alanine-DL-glutamate epimerase-like enolase superfamily enzyme
VGGDAVRIHDGYMSLSDAPGLGLHMNLDALEDVPAGDEPAYRWRHFKE